MAGKQRKRPLVVAHRGASGIAPENTLVSFRRAIAQGADMIEFDVRMTADFHIVVLHDRDLKRTTGKNAKVWDMTLQQLRLLEAGSWFHPRFAGEQIPTLRQVLEMMPEGVIANIEVKTDGDRRKKLAFEEVCILTIMEKKCEDRVLVSSFDHKFIKRLHSLYPSIRTGALYMPVRDARKSPSLIARKTGAKAFICNHTMLGQRFIRDARLRKMFVATYVVNTEDHLQRAVDLGVDAVITDFPGRTIRSLDRMGLPPRTRAERQSPGSPSARFR
jgi:glycerophosphoryl diester phosphodiesterase